MFYKIVSIELSSIDEMPSISAFDFMIPYYSIMSEALAHFC